MIKQIRYIATHYCLPMGLKNFLYVAGIAIMILGTSAFVVLFG